MWTAYLGQICMRICIVNRIGLLTMSVLVSLSTAVSFPCAASGLPTIDEIRLTWSRREELVEAADIRFKKVLTIGKGSQFGASGLPGPNGPVFPPADLTVVNFIRFIVDGDRFRFIVSGPQWDNRAEAVVDSEHVLIFDGHEYRASFGVPEKNDRVHPIGFISSASTTGLQESGLALPHSVPITHAIRPVNSRFGTPVKQDWKVQPETELINERSCVVLTSGKGRLSQQLWVDPASEWSVIRWSVSFDGKIFMQTDVKYSNRDWPFIPTGWSMIRYETATGQFAESQEIPLESLEINKPVSADAFQLDFPVDAFVTANLGTEQQQSWIARPNNEKRLVTREESRRTPTYTQLLETKSGQAALDGTRGRWMRWVLAVSGILLPLVILGLASRRRVARDR